MTVDALIEEIKGDPLLKEIVWHERMRPLEASFAMPGEPLHSGCSEALAAGGITELYSHQARSLELLRKGKNLVVMTPTASGKSLIYNLAVLEEILKDRSSTALYVFPLKGLIHDQFKALSALNETLGIENLSAVYDGDTTAYRRKKIRDNPPSIIFTNPDMLHLAINPHHEGWAAFLKNLKFVVIDEIHSYRGVFGSHVAHVFRRLRRIAGAHGARPAFIASSATIANPREISQMLTGVDFECVDYSGAPSGKKNFLFLNPEKNPHSAATRLFIKSLRAGLKTIAFTRARKVTELMDRWVKEQAPELGDTVSSYRAGFLPEERRDIEARLSSGELSGVISTSALELGIDIGGLDACILVGYPGTISSTWQRAGRAGRGRSDSLITLVAMPDALDQYFMRDPEDFFSRRSEAAVLDTTNPFIQKSHLLCAASEVRLKRDDPVYSVTECLPQLLALEKDRLLRYWRGGETWYARKRNPQRGVSIRASGLTFKIVDEEGSPIGTCGSARVLKELHPGAIYLHMGSRYVVVGLHMGKREAICRTMAAGYYTVAETNEETEILASVEERPLGETTLHRGNLRVTEEVTGYWKKDLYTREILRSHTLELPSQVFTTTGIWMTVDEGITEGIGTLGYDVPGGLHALEHALIATLPLYAICDRMDLGGVSYVYNPELQSAAIFIYDGHDGGVGLAGRGFLTAPEWFRTTMTLLEECPCELSCPSCTQDQNCGNGNDPLDKRAALYILKTWLSSGLE